MNIRKYAVPDLMEILQLFYDTVHTVNSKDYSQEQVDAWAPKQLNVERWADFFAKNISYVAEIDGKITGFGDLTREGYLNTLYVHKDFQGKGIGSRIVKILEKEAKALSLNEITTEASITAKPFFEKRGYECLRSQNKVHNGMVFLNYVMRKKLN